MTKSHHSISWTRSSGVWRANKFFPNLRSIVVAGHSAGGQFVTRYEMSNRVHDSISIPISYVVSNASAYTYVDDMRPTSTALPKTVAAASPGFQPAASAAPPPPFVPYADARNCVGLTTGLTGLKTASATRRGSPMMSSRSSLSLDQPPTCSEKRTFCLWASSTPHARPWPKAPRAWRAALAFNRYANELHGANHKVVVVPFCSHSARCMFTSDAALPLIFPN